MTDKLTMGAIWEDLDDTDREIIATMVGIQQGQLALMQIHKVLRAIGYRYHDRKEYDHHAAEFQRQYEKQIAQLHAEMQQQKAQMAYEQQRMAQRTIISDNTAGFSDWKKWW